MRQQLQAVLEEFRPGVAWTPEQHERWQRLAASFGRVWDGPDGKEVLVFLLNVTDPFFSAYTGNSDGYYKSALQDVGRLITHVLTLARPNALSEIISAGKIGIESEDE